MLVAVAQLNPTVGDIGGNVRKIIEAVENAVRAGAHLAVFPELAVTGYPPRDLLCRRDFLARVEYMLAEVLAPRSRDIAVLIGAPVREETGPERSSGYGAAAEDAVVLFNSALLYSGGRLIGRQDKSLLPNYDVFDESRYFRPASARKPVLFKGGKLGLTVCEDIWNDKDYWNRRLYDVDPVEELAGQGAELVINISASPYHYGKTGLRLDMLRNMARKHGTGFVYANQVGGNDELIFDGASMVVNRDGNMVCMAESFAEDLLLFDTRQLNAGRSLPPRSEAQPAIGEDAGYVYRALILGIRDYLHKTGFAKALVGLSGGIDSSVTAALAAAALGPERVLGVSMPSRYSSPGSRSDARQLAANLGIAFREVPIEEMFAAFTGVMNDGGDCRGDLAEENIQARIRGNILMFISNREGHLLLTTGNKSEMAVGYCTLYGDMCGGLAVLSDVPKVMVYELARYINREREIIPQSVLLKPPSAELKPGQVDLDSLPPYEVLDAVLCSYIEKNMPADEIVALGYDPDVVQEIIRKVDKAEYKRRQAAPGLRVTAKAFGVGRRMPIAWRPG